MTSRLRTFGWLALLSGVFIVFFHETIFRGFSLVPTDVLHELIWPYDAAVQDVHVQNHYTCDILRMEYPWALLWQDEMRHGELPLWNPEVYGGQPHMAVSMHGVFSPFKVLYLFLSAERAFSLGIVLELWMAGALMFAFLRQLGRSGAAAFLGGIAYALNSAFLMWYWQVPSTFVWAPLILLLVERSVHRTSWGCAAGAGLVLGLAMVSGSIQASAHLGFLCVGYLAGTIVAADGASRARTAQRAGVVFLVGMLVYAVQLLPTLELLLNEGSHRLEMVGQKASLRHTLLGIPFLITFMFPGLAGSTESYGLARAFGTDMAEYTGYIGIVPFVLFIVGALVMRERPVRWLLLTAGTALAIIFCTPLLRFVYHRFFVVVVFAMCVVAAYGMDALLEMPAASRRAIRRAMIGVLAAGVIVLLGVVAAQWVVATHWNRLLEVARTYVAEHRLSVPFGPEKWRMDRVPLFLHHYRITNAVFWLPLTLLAGTVLGWQLHARGRLSRNAFCAVLLMFTVADLTVLGRTIVPQVDLRQFPLYPPLEAIAAVQEDHGLFRVEEWPPGDTVFLMQSVLNAYGLSVVIGHDSLAPENLSLFPFRSIGQWTPVADLLNIKYVFVSDSTTLPENHFSLLKQSQGVRLYRNDRCLPRMQFIPAWKTVPDRREILAAMIAPTFEPQQAVFVETDPPQSFRSPPDATTISQTGAASVDVEQYAPRLVRARVQCAEPGVVLLADTFYPGWQATVDGAPTRIYRADCVMRAVFVSAGDHEIVFHYAPLAFRLGAAVSAATIVVLAVIGVWLRVRHHGRGHVAAL